METEKIPRTSEHADKVVVVRTRALRAVGKELRLVTRRPPPAHINLGIFLLPPYLGSGQSPWKKLYAPMAASKKINFPFNCASRKKWYMNSFDHFFLPLFFLTPFNKKKEYTWLSTKVGMGGRKKKKKPLVWI